jgi:hypothetical protein
MHSWRMFIASSTKGLRYARAIKDVIDREFGAPVCFLWSHGAFDAGRSFLDSLEQLSSKYNCGLAVFSADDQLGDLMAPRDNVVLEFGLFLGIFGRSMSFLVVEGREELKIPSDYAGIAVNRFFPVNESASDEDHRNAVFGACMDVVGHLKRTDPVPLRPEALRRLEANWRRKYSGQEFQLFTFCGLCDWPDDSSTHEGYVYHLWADAAAASWIRASVIDEKPPEGAAHAHIFRVEFRNEAGGFPANVAIRPKKRQVASADAKGFQRLRFSARALSSTEATPGSETTLAIGVRIMDALTTHWEYCRVAHEYILMSLSAGEDWKEFEILLGDPTRWSVFHADGNYRYHDDRPDFSKVLGVVVEMGSKAKGRPGAGSGTILLKGFCLE